MPEHLRVTRDGPVAIIAIDRPPANALEANVLGAVTRALDEIDASDAGAVVLTGTGSCFSAGLDLKEVPRYTQAQQRDLILALNRFLGRLYAYPGPVVAAVNGHAIAGGLVAALACDRRVGTNAPCRLGLTEARAGVPFPVAPMAVVQAELTPAVARELVLVARNVDPARALAMGVLDELQEPQHVMPRALDVARDLAGIDRAVYARTKRDLRAAAIARIDEANAEGNDPALDAWLGAGSAAAAAAVLRGDAGT